MSDNPHQRSPGQRIPAGMAVSDKLHIKNISSQMCEETCFTPWNVYTDHVLYLILVVKFLKVLY
jgi:hypothetical protein